MIGLQGANEYKEGQDLWRILAWLKTFRRFYVPAFVFKFSKSKVLVP